MMRVLIVDDKEQNLYLLQTLLQSSGYQVETARDGAEALARARSQPPQLAISDLLMPVIDGYMLLRQWRADSRLRPIPFVVYTATYTEPEDERLAMQLGADAFILKPMEPGDFMARINQVLADSAAGRLARPQPGTGEHESSFKQYSEILVHKLEQKSIALAESNRNLECDIAERRQSEEALRERERQLATLMSNLPGMAYRCRNDRQWTMEFVSEGAQALTGHPTSDLIGNRNLAYADLIHPADREAVWNQVQASLERREPFVLIYRLRTATGEERWVWEQGRGIFGSQNELLALEGLILDITERKRAEQELHESHKMLQRVINNIPQHVFWKDLDLKYLGANAVFARSGGLQEPADIIGKSDFDLSWKESAEAYRTDDRTVIESGAPKLNYEETQKRSDGDLRWLRTSKLPLTDDDGKIMGMLGIYEDITERKRAEAELAATQRRYHELFDNIAVGLVRTTPGMEGIFIDVNPAMVAMFEADNREQLLAVLPSEMFLDSSERRIFSDTLTSQGFIKGQEIRFKTLKGRPIWCRITAVKKIDANGQIYFDSTLEDITERKQAEDALQQEEALFKNLASTIPDCIYFKDRQSRFIRVNASSARLFGLRSPDEAVGKTDFDVHGEEHARQAFEDEQRAMATGESIIDLEEKETWPDGHVTWASSTKVPLRNAEGRITGIVGISRDITERKRAEEELRKLSRIIEQAPLSVVITDLSGAIEYVNPRFCAVTGYKPEEILGQNPRMLKSGQTPPEVYHDMWTKLTHNEIWSGELRNRRKNGEIYLETAVIAPVVDASGRATHYVALKDDITAERRFAEESNAKLAKEHEISEMKTRFISLISHEFRTPLAAAMASAELLHHHFDRLAIAKREQLFGRINSSVVRLTGMLDEVLTLNRMDVGSTELRLEPVDFWSFLHDVTEEILLADHDAHRIESHAAGDSPTFVTDPNLLRHIITNLLGNALRYSPAGTLITMRMEADSQRMKLSIEDQGIGIPEADRERIFAALRARLQRRHHPGHRPWPQHRETHDRAARRHDRLESIEAGGSRFTLALPRRKAPATPS